MEESGMYIDEALISVVRELGGGDAVTVTKVLLKGEEVTDEQVAERANLRINVVRRILYSFFDNQLVSYRRVRDKETGWYIYYWKINSRNLDVLIKVKKQKVLDKLKQRLDYEKNRVFFYCAANGCIRIPFEEAVEHSFKCPKCMAPLENEDNSSFVNSLEDRISILEKDLAMLGI